MRNILDLAAVVCIGIGAIGFLYAHGSARGRLALFITCVLTGVVIGYVARQWF